MARKRDSRQVDERERKSGIEKEKAGMVRDRESRHGKRKRK